MRGLRVVRRSLAALAALSCAAALSGCSLLSSPPPVAAPPLGIPPASSVSSASPPPSSSPQGASYLAVFGTEASSVFQQGLSKAAESSTYCRL